jgi:hypothetical protein
MQDTSGLTGAAPIWAEFFQEGIQHLTGGNPTGFSRPAGIIERVICSVSGTEPSEYCPDQRSEYFAADQPPLPKSEDLWDEVEIDTWTNKLASDDCSEYTDEVLGVRIEDKWGRKWVKNTKDGKDWAEDMGLTRKPYTIKGENICSDGDPRPMLEFGSPVTNETVTSSPLKISARVDASGLFKEARLDYGPGKDPAQWKTIKTFDNRVTSIDEVYTWDISGIPAGWVTLRLYMSATNEGYAEKKIQVNFQVPTPTPTISPTPSETPSPSPTFTATSSETPIPSDTPSPTPTPSQTPTP